MMLPVLALPAEFPGLRPGGSSESSVHLDAATRQQRQQALISTRASWSQIVHCFRRRRRRRRRHNRPRNETQEYQTTTATLAMDRRTPPSPAPSGISLHHDYVQQHHPMNFPSQLLENMAPAVPFQTHSQPGTRYGTPVPHPLSHSQSFDTGLQQQYQRAISVHPQYHNQLYGQDSSPYGPIPEPYSTPATSPPTPARHAELMNSNIRNSPLRNLTRSSKIEKKPPRKKKSSADSKKLEGKVASLLLDKPLSQQKVPEDLVITNMEEYVNRGKDVRQREVESGKNPGKVKRPMNAFMLYRKTYQGVAKGWADEHNHQVVSRVCGMSWPMEPEQVREQFKAWAEKERENHQQAFPDYKFTPTKPSKAPKYKDGNESECSDPEWDPTGSMRSRALTRARSLTRASSDDFDDHPQYVMGRLTYPPYGYSASNYNTMAAFAGHRSAFEYSNPGKAMPAPYEPHTGALRDGSYYEAQVHTPPRHVHHGMSVEDIVMRRTPSPTMAYSGGHSHGLSMSKADAHSLSQYGQPMFSDHFTASPPQYDLPTQQSQLLKQEHYDHQHEQKYDPHLEQKYHHHSHDSQHEQKYDAHHHEHKYHMLDEPPRIDPSLENVYTTSAGAGIHSMIGNDGGGGGGGGGGGDGDNKNSVMTQATTSSTQSAWQPNASGSSGGAGPMASGADSDNGSGSQFVDSFNMYEDDQMRPLIENDWQVESVDPPLPDSSHFDMSWMTDQPVVADAITVKTELVSHTP
ncbi:hypothetical protein QBC45DRAFT_449357 [Copromyces sp. CBS 386.78]|nr:hypothetical protein QBC45DRAFT_449357 [Copromyces sp. CBS 386.78]